MQGVSVECGHDFVRWLRRTGRLDDELRRVLSLCPHGCLCVWDKDDEENGVPVSFDLDCIYRQSSIATYERVTTLFDEYARTTPWIPEGEDDQ